MSNRRRKAPAKQEPLLLFGDNTPIGDSQQSVFPLADNRPLSAQTDSIIEVEAEEVLEATPVDVAPRTELDAEKQKKLFDIKDLNKREIDKLTRSICEEVLEEGYDALKLICLAEKYGYLAERIQDLLKKSESVINEVEHYGKGGVSQLGVNLVASENVRYIYEDDENWKILKAEVDRATTAMKEYQEQMKSAPISGRELIDEESGEVITVIRKAVRQGSTIIKATILK